MHLSGKRACSSCLRRWATASAVQTGTSEVWSCYFWLHSSCSPTLCFDALLKWLLPARYIRGLGPRTAAITILSISALGRHSSDDGTRCWFHTPLIVIRNSCPLCTRLLIREWSLEHTTISFTWSLVRQHLCESARSLTACSGQIAITLK